MKPKLLVALVIALTTAGLWLWFGRKAPQPLAKTVTEVRAQAAPKIYSPRPTKVGMVAISSKPKQSLNSSRNDLSGILLIVANNEEYHKRMRALDALPSKLTEADWKLLQTFLLAKDPADYGQVGQVFKNAVMDKLCAMASPPQDFGDTLIEIYQDGNQNEVIRDYAVQHLATLDEKLAQTQSSTQELKTGQQVLWQALNETSDSIAGTALIGLERLSEQDAQVDQSRIAQAALTMAGDGNAGELAHITAYQVCAQLSVPGALPVIEAAVQGGQTISIQISAIGALGSLGGTDDIPLLQRLLQGSEERLKLPAKVAIEKIEQRMGQQSSAKSNKTL